MIHRQELIQNSTSSYSFWRNLFTIYSYCYRHRQEQTLIYLPNSLASRFKAPLVQQNPCLEVFNRTLGKLTPRRGLPEGFLYIFSWNSLVFRVNTSCFATFLINFSEIESGTFLAIASLNLPLWQVKHAFLAMSSFLQSFPTIFRTNLEAGTLSWALFFALFDLEAFHRVSSTLGATWVSTLNVLWEK